MPPYIHRDGKSFLKQFPCRRTDRNRWMLLQTPGGQIAASTDSIVQSYRRLAPDRADLIRCVPPRRPEIAASGRDQWPAWHPQADPRLPATLHGFAPSQRRVRRCVTARPRVHPPSAPRTVLQTHRRRASCHDSRRSLPRSAGPDCQRHTGPPRVPAKLAEAHRRHHGQRPECAVQGHSGRRCHHRMHLWPSPGPCRDRTTCDTGVPDPPSSPVTPSALMVAFITRPLTICQGRTARTGNIGRNGRPPERCHPPNGTGWSSTARRKSEGAERAFVTGQRLRDRLPTGPSRRTRDGCFPPRSC